MASETKFGVDYAKRVAKCKECKQQIDKQNLRMWRMIPNPFAEKEGQPSEWKNFYHAHCLFETLGRSRVNTKVIESDADIEGWDVINVEDQEKLKESINSLSDLRLQKFGDKLKKAQPPPNKESKETEKEKKSKSKNPDDSSSTVDQDQKSKKLSKKEEKFKEKKKDEKKQSKKSKNEKTARTSEETAPGPSRKSKYDSFKLFCKLCEVIGSVSKYTDKTTAVRMFVTKDDYDGDLYLLLKLLIPSADQRVYNIKAKQLINHFSKIFKVPAKELSDSYNQSGDISATLCEFIEKRALPHKTAHLTNQAVDKWLDDLTQLTADDEQLSHLSKIFQMAIPLELKYIIRLINKDLRFNAGAKHILEGLEKGAYEAFQNSQDLHHVISKYKNDKEMTKLDSGIILGTPVKPMLPCRSVEQAMSKCKDSMYAEIKYDGERLQLHKNGDKFTFFSRSLKPSLDHKVEHLSKAVQEAFPTNKDLIVDAEMLLVDTKTGKPLPFGTLGIHKKKEFADATVRVQIGNARVGVLHKLNILLRRMTLLGKESEHFEVCTKLDSCQPFVSCRTLLDRRKLLEDQMKEIPNRVLLSNRHIVKAGESEKLKSLIWMAIDDGLEGLVLKDVDSIYEPGKRHWLKVKKDYLDEGAMADSADLIVLGAYYGTGSKGGMMSVFLMGTYDIKKKKYLTVTKCGNGHDDATLEQINKDLKPKMKEISRVYEKLPKWLQCARSLVPDFVMSDPKSAPVWEITGAEFSHSNNHTANGISIRFPRVTRIRNDKNWETATSLDELTDLYNLSKKKVDDDALVNMAPLYEKTDFNVPSSETVVQQDLEGSKKRKRALTPVEEKDEEPRKTKMPCKYGASCYRKNKKHREDFLHPE